MDPIDHLNEFEIEYKYNKLRAVYMFLVGLMWINTISTVAKHSILGWILDQIESFKLW